MLSIVDSGYIPCFEHCKQNEVVLIRTSQMECKNIDKLKHKRVNIMIVSPGLFRVFQSKFSPIIIVLSQLYTKKKTQSRNQPSGKACYSPAMVRSPKWCRCDSPRKQPRGSRKQPRGSHVWRHWRLHPSHATPARQNGPTLPFAHHRGGGSQLLSPSRRSFFTYSTCIWTWENDRPLSFGNSPNFGPNGYKWVVAELDCLNYPGHDTG